MTSTSHVLAPASPPSLVGASMDSGQKHQGAVPRRLFHAPGTAASALRSKAERLQRQAQDTRLFTRPNVPGMSKSGSSLQGGAQSSTSRPSGFLAQSSAANQRAATREQNKSASKRYSFKRDDEARFGTGERPAAHCARQASEIDAAYNGADGSATDFEAQRDQALRLVETLQIGGCSTRAPLDDVHFAKVEPNSHIPLRRRFMPHLEVQAHLDGRYVVPVNKLYSIVLDEPSSDGDVTVPIDGDWLVFGVLVESSEVIVGKPWYIDENGVRHKIIEKTPELEAAKIYELERRGLCVLDPPQWRTLTLLDLSKELDNAGEHHGSDQIMITVFKADRTHDEDGERKYVGGSNGAFELLGDWSLGTVICVMNAKIKYWRKGSSRENPPSPDESSQMGDKTSARRGSGRLLSLAPRGKNTLMRIGIARDYKQCEAIRKDGKRCQNFVDMRTEQKACSFHMTKALSQTRNRRQEFASGTSALVKPLHMQNNSVFAFSDGMSRGPLSRPIVHGGFGLGGAPRKNEVGSSSFDVTQYFGRDRGESLKRGKRDCDDDVLSARLRRRTQDNRECSRVLPPAASEVKRVRKADAEISKAAQGSGCITSKRGGRVEAANGSLPRGKIEFGSTAEHVAPGRRTRDQMQGLAQHVQYKGPALLAFQQIQAVDSRSTMKSSQDRRKASPRTTFERNMTSGKDSTRLASVSHKLLARHEATSHTLPRPILRARNSAAQRKAFGKSSVRPPPGKSFYASDDSDEEFEAIVQDADFCIEFEAGNSGRQQQAAAQAKETDDDSDIEIVS